MQPSEQIALPEIKTYETAGGARIFQIPVQDFPMLWGQIYLVLLENVSGEPYRVLIDTGSGFGDANQQIEAGFQAVSRRLGTLVGLADLTHILITHAHIDHFGGLKYIRPRTRAKLGVHELDLRNLTHYEERLAVVAHHLAEFLIEAGVEPEKQAGLIELYKITKSLYHSVQVDFTYEDVGMRLGPFEMLHVPGHCAGHVVIRLHDVLFCGDHVLRHTTPHQSPEVLTSFTGLEHYLRSLDLLQDWAGEVRLGLPGHEDPITDLEGRIDAIRQMHHERLGKVLEILAEPHTVKEVSRALFNDVRGYEVLLALEEAGAHVEYLYQRGLLGIANLAELEGSQTPVAIRYYRT